METSEIRELSTPDIIERIDTERTMHDSMKLYHAIKAMDNPQEMREVKLTIARLLTELRSRELKEKSKI